MLGHLGYCLAKFVKHLHVVLVLIAEVEVDIVHATAYDRNIDLVSRDHVRVLQLGREWDLQLSFE